MGIYAQGIVESSVGAIAVKKAVLLSVTAVVNADDLALVVDAKGVGALGGQGVVERCVAAATVEKPVIEVAVIVKSDDLTGGIDAERRGTPNAQGVVERCVAAAAVEEAVAAGAAVVVSPNDLAGGVDAVCLDAAVCLGGQRIINGSVTASTVEEAVVGPVISDDLAGVVDALCKGTNSGRIVERGVGVDRHDALCYLHA